MLTPFPWRYVVVFSLMFGGTTLDQAWGQSCDLPWTVLIPENDSRAPDVRDYDLFDSRSLVLGMNESEKVFGHHLNWSKLAVKDLPTHSTPFCELRFDAVNPLFLTEAEKKIVREYFARGGFILFQEDAYPYSQDEFWSVHSWPIIDFLTRELPASSPDFSTQKVTDAHALFHIHYDTQTALSTRHELQDNPYTPNRTLLFYRGRACAFVYGRYNLIEDGKWVAMPRPFVKIFSLDPRGYQLTVNIYVYATTH
jgi:hypothetical protein